MRACARLLKEVHSDRMATSLLRKLCVQRTTRSAFPVFCELCRRPDFPNNSIPLTAVPQYMFRRSCFAQDDIYTVRVCGTAARGTGHRQLRFSRVLGRIFPRRSAKTPSPGAHTMFTTTTNPARSHPCLNSSHDDGNESPSIPAGCY